MYKYYIYGLGFESEVKLYHLEQSKNVKTDVLIHFGVMEEHIIESAKRGVTNAVFQNKVWFSNNTGIFLISNGNEIIIQPKNGATENDIASFILGWSISFLFQQRQILAIHCSALEMYGQAVFISGNSGVGKSTIALSLLGAGYKYLADDIAMVDLKNDLIIQPAFPQQKVCRNVAESIGSDSLFYIDEQKDKFAYINNDDFCSEPRRLTTMFLLERYLGDELIIKKLKGIDMWNRVINNLFLIDAYRALSFPPGEKERCLELAGKIDMYLIRRPDGKDTVNEIRETIIQVVKDKQYV